MREQSFKDSSVQSQRNCKIVKDDDFHIFQHSLFLEITILVIRLKSTLLLKMKCFDTHFYMKTECLQTNRQHC